MKGASRQTRWIYLESPPRPLFRSAEPPEHASPVVSGSDSWHEPVTVELPGFKSSTFSSMERRRGISKLPAPTEGGIRST
jgi:hypothetical protein